VLAAKHFELPQGTVATTTRTFNCDKLRMKVTGSGENMEGVVTRKDTSVESLESLGGGKLRRLLASTSVEGEVIMNGKKSNPPYLADTLVEVPVILTHEAGKWAAALEDGKPYPAQESGLKKLEKSFATVEEKALVAYGDTPRKPGDKWEAGPAAFDPANFPGFAEAEQIEGKVTIEFKEQKVFEGAPCALLKVSFDLKGKPKGAGEKATLTFKGEGKVLRSLREKMDVAWEHKGTIRINDPTDPDAVTSLEGPISVSGLVEVKRP
jgi:hypothetical protein